MLALPVLAVRVLDAAEFQMGLLGFFEFLAFLVVGLPAGAWVDRWRKQWVLITGDVVRALALASLPLAWAARRADPGADVRGRGGDRRVHRVLRRRLPELPARHRRARAHRRGQRQAPGLPVRGDDRRPGRRRRPDQARRSSVHHRAGRAQLPAVRALRTPDPAHRHASIPRGTTAPARGDPRGPLLRAEEPPAVADHGVHRHRELLLLDDRRAARPLLPARPRPRRGAHRPRHGTRRRRRARRRAAHPAHQRR